MKKPDVTEDVLEILAWRKAVRLIHNNHKNSLISMVKLLMAELNIHESTARAFIVAYKKYEEQIVELIKTDPFKNDRRIDVDNHVDKY